jgi:cytochrome c oxidase subunit 3
LSTHVSTPAQHGHTHHEPHLAHHFEDRAQQDEAHSLGLWIFLVTEVMFFGGLFLAFTVYHVLYPEAFGIASGRLSVHWGVINTIVLLFSSFTMAMAVHSAQTGKQKKLVMFLVITFLCALGFMGIKAIEWTEKYQHHLIPGSSFAFSLDEPHGGHVLSPQQIETMLMRDPYVERHAQMFYVMYFCITGLHGIHVLIGMGLILWMILRARKREFGPRWNTPIELTGLYWHFVDVIWIYVFPLIYLIHRH